jgi:hypothetical protein
VAGRLNHPISIGGVTVNPGDLVVGDADGVTVIERDKAAAMLPLAAEKVAAETQRIADIKSRKALRPRLAGRRAARGGRDQGRRDAVSKAKSAGLPGHGPTWPAQALALLTTTKWSTPARTPTEADIVALCRQHDPVAIIVRYGKVGAAAMDAAPRLKVISKHGSGTDTIDKAAAAERGIQVTAAAGANAAAVAEQAMALLLACAKSVVTLNARMHAGHWDKATHKSVELEGRTVGLVGLGAIGLRFARMADAMGMRVLGFDPYAKEVPAYVERWTWPRSGANPMPSRCTAR